MNVSQESSISSILYLFYNADLLNLCDKSKVKTSVIKFVDDINILAYNQNTEKNCKTLKRLHKECEK